MMASSLAILYVWVDRPGASDAGQHTLSGKLVDTFGATWALPAGMAIFTLLALLLLAVVILQMRRMRNWWGAPLPAAPVHPIWGIHTSPAAEYCIELACAGGAVYFALVAAWVWSEHPSASDVGRHTFSGRLVETFGPDWARFGGVALFVALALLMAVAAGLLSSRLRHRGSKARSSPTKTAA
jgi:hypothetical protein